MSKYSIVLGALGIASSILRGQQPGRPEIPIEACDVAPLEQFRFVVAAAVGTSLPVARTPEGERVTVSQLVVDRVTCGAEPMRAEMHGRVKRVAAPPSSDSAVAAVTMSVALLAAAGFRGDSLKPAHAPATLTGARLCAGAVEVARLEGRIGAALDKARVRGWVSDAFRDRCFDITSLVYVFLERGGSLSRPR